MIQSFLLTLLLVNSPLRIQVLLNQRPLAQQKISVIGFLEGEQKFDKILKTDPNGRTQIEIAPKPPLNIILQTQFQNVAYFSAVMSSMAIPKEDVKISVYPAVASDAAVMIEDLRLFLKESDDGIRIDEEIVILNPSGKTIVGKNADPKAKEGAESFRLQVPTGAFDLQFDSGFSQETTRFEGNDIILTRPLMPGRTHLGLHFAVERGRLSLPFQQNFSLPVHMVSLGSTDSDLRFSGQPFIPGPNKWMADNQVFTWTAKPPSPTPRLAFEIQGLHIQYRISEILGPLTLFILLMGLLFFRRTKPSVPSQSDLPLHLEEWARIHELQKRGVLSQEDLISRKMKNLERLIPLMKDKL